MKISKLFRIDVPKGYRKKIIQLFNRVKDLEKRALEQERHSSKVFLIFYNVPLDKNVDLEEGICQFLFDYLNISAYTEDFKAFIQRPS